MIEAFAIDIEKPWTKSKPGFAGQAEDVESYKLSKERWQNQPTSQKIHGPNANLEFMSFDEYISRRETWLPNWQECYDKMLIVPSPSRMMATPAVP